MGGHGTKRPCPTARGVRTKGLTSVNLEIPRYRRRTKYVEEWL